MKGISFRHLTIVVLGLLFTVSPLYTSHATNWTGWTVVHENDGSSVNPGMAYDSSADTIHLVWSDDTPGNYEIFYKNSTDGGATWGGWKRLTNNDGWSGDPAIAFDPQSNVIHVVWSDHTTGNGDIYYKKSTDDGATWAGFRRISFNTTESKNPDIAIDNNDNLHVVWQDINPNQGDKYDIYYKKSTNGGSSWAGFRRISFNTGASVNPAIATDSANRIHVVWSDDTTGGGDIYYKKSTNGGSSWGTFRKIGFNSQASVQPAIAIDSNDHIHVAWADLTPSDNYEILYKQSTNAGGSWTDFKRVTFNDRNSMMPAMCVNSVDDLHLVWSDQSPTPIQWDIYYKRGDQ